MKRFLIILLAFLMLLSFAACEGLSENDETSAYSNDSAETPESTAEADTSEDPKGSDGESTQVGDTAEKPISPPEIADTETPWYITDWEPTESYTEPEVPAEMQTLAVKVPLVCMEEKDGISIKAEFFQEYWLLGSPIQARLTVMNLTNETVWFSPDSLGGGCFIAEDASSRKALPATWGFYPREHEKEYYTYVYYMQEDEGYVEIPAGESLVLEQLYMADPEFFSQEYTHTYQLTVAGYIEEQYNHDREILYSFDYSVEVLEVVLTEE